MSSGSLFEVRTRTDRSPSHARESLIDFVNRAAGPYWDRVREHLTVWVDQYPAQHRDDVRGRLCSRIDIDFHAAYWELFNFQVLRRAGFELTCHPEMPGTGKRPDFLVEGHGSRFYLEAKLLGDSQEERRRQRERNQIWNELDRRVQSEHFFVRLGVPARGHSPLPFRSLASATTAWLAELDVESVRRQVELGGLVNVESFVWADERSGWSVSLSPIPKSRHSASDRLVGMGEAEAWFADDRTAIRKTLDRKSHRYGQNLDAPLVVALSMGRAFVDDTDLLDALFGDEVVHVHRETMETELGRAHNGLWLGARGPKARGLSAVLAAKGVSPWSLGGAQLKLWVNPWAARPVDLAVPCIGAVTPRDTSIERRDAAESVLSWLNLPADWPGPEQPFDIRD